MYNCKNSLFRILSIRLSDPKIQTTQEAAMAAVPGCFRYEIISSFDRQHNLAHTGNQA